MRGLRLAWLALALPLALWLSGCGTPLTAAQAVQQSAQAMANLSGYRISGSTSSGEVTVSFHLLVLADGDFAGQVDTTVTGSPELVTGVTAIGSEVWVQSPTELQQLGITSLPGNLSPATAWVLQSPTIAASYRHSLSPFIDGGLANTLDHQAQERLSLARVSWHQQRTYRVDDFSGRQHLRLYLSRPGFRLLSLAVTGKHQVQLSYSPAPASATVAAPPSAQVYAPPTSSPSG